MQLAGTVHLRFFRKRLLVGLEALGDLAVADLTSPSLPDDPSECGDGLDGPVH